jgi:hypothetical protein
LRTVARSTYANTRAQPGRRARATARRRGHRSLTIDLAHNLSTPDKVIQILVKAIGRLAAIHEKLGYIELRVGPGRGVGLRLPLS